MSGMLADTRVPPAAGLSIRSRPSRTASRSASPVRPLPSAPGASDAVVAHLDDERAVFDPRHDRGAFGVGVLGDVGQRLGDDEVGGRLDRGGKPVDGDVGLDRHLHPRRQRVDRRAQPAADQDRRKDPVGELTQFEVRVLRVVERFADQIVDGLPVRAPALRRPS